MTKTKPKTPAELIQLLDLQPHPEGGYYAETFRDQDHLVEGGRAASTLIYYLMEQHNFSHIHRLDAAEGWHFYAGQAFNVVELNKDGPKVTRLGTDFANGERPQYVVKPNMWFGSKPAEGSSWALLGCSVAPGFEFEKFEIGKREKLLEEFPNCEKWIRELTRE